MKKGFTLVELLAVVVILGLVGSIAVILVTRSVDNSRRKTYASLGKTYGESVRKLRAEDRLPYKPKEGEAVLFLAEFLDVQNGTVSPYAKIVFDKSYVVITKDGDNFKYFVTLVDEKHNGIIGEDFNLIEEDTIKTDEDGTREITSIQAIKGGVPLTVDNESYKFKTTREKYIIMQTTSVDNSIN